LAAVPERTGNRWRSNPSLHCANVAASPSSPSVKIVARLIALPRVPSFQGVPLLRGAPLPAKEPAAWSDDGECCCRGERPRRRKSASGAARIKWPARRCRRRPRTRQMRSVIDALLSPRAKERRPAESKNPPSSAGGRKTTNRISPCTGAGDSCQALLYAVVPPTRTRCHPPLEGAWRGGPSHMVVIPAKQARP
jgi:hypothetical protein